jgi:hypothetical protein
LSPPAATEPAEPTGPTGPTDDAIARYRAASEANDMPALLATLAEDATLVSPLSARMVFRGKQDLSVLLPAVYGLLTSWRWEEPYRDGDRIVLVGDGRIGPFRLGDAMAIELDADGRICRIRPHLRPFLGLLAFAALLGPKLAGHPGLIARAARG